MTTYKLLVNAPTGEQRIEVISVSGAYYDQNKVVWDERFNGVLPEITLGKMQRVGALLNTLPDYLPAHAAWMAEQAIIQADIDEKEALKTESTNDGDLAQLREMSGDEINAWFDLNVTNLNQTIRMLKKVVKSLVKQELL